tara:strand:- start:8 stop:187 length:180 start_codon:yes stop_codon:yes gene_type:complete
VLRVLPHEHHEVHDGAEGVGQLREVLVVGHLLEDALERLEVLDLAPSWQQQERKEGRGE